MVGKHAFTQVHWLWAIAFMLILGACTETTDVEGRLVRHYFGYVKFLTPASNSLGTEIRTTEIESYGGWFYVDDRGAGEDQMGYGVGLGYQSDRRDYIPLGCRVVVRVANEAQLESAIEKLATINGGEGLCAIQD